MIRLENIKTTYNKKNILNQITFRIDPGEIHVIIGANGAGKTTLLKTINGLITPKEGSVHIRNELLTQKSKKALCKRMGYIPQDMGLIANTSVFENVLLGALARVGTLRSLFNQWTEQERVYAKQLLTELNIAHKMRARVYELSGGEKRRVAIARALMQKPDILLGDEIFSDIDFVHAESIVKTLQKLKKRLNLTIALVEHNFATVQACADRVSILRRGRIVQTTRPYSISAKSMCPLFE